MKIMIVVGDRAERIVDVLASFMPLRHDHASAVEILVATARRD